MRDRHLDAHPQVHGVRRHDGADEGEHQKLGVEAEGAPVQDVEHDDQGSSVRGQDVDSGAPVEVLHARNSGAGAAGRAPRRRRSIQFTGLRPMSYLLSLL